LLAFVSSGKWPATWESPVYFWLTSILKWNVCKYHISNNGELVMNVGGVRFLKLPEVEHICLFPMAQFVGG